MRLVRSARSGKERRGVQKEEERKTSPSDNEIRDCLITIFSPLPGAPERREECEKGHEEALNNVRSIKWEEIRRKDDCLGCSSRKKTESRSFFLLQWSFMNENAERESLLMAFLRRIALCEGRFGLRAGRFAWSWQEPREREKCWWTFCTESKRQQRPGLDR